MLCYAVKFIYVIIQSKFIKNIYINYKQKSIVVIVITVCAFCSSYLLKALSSLIQVIKMKYTVLYDHNNINRHKSTVITVHVIPL